jgi:hypothetical protein
LAFLRHPAPSISPERGGKGEDQIEDYGLIIVLVKIVTLV